MTSPKAVACSLSAFADCASTNPDVASVCASFSCAAAFELAASSLAAAADFSKISCCSLSTP